jgi:predicted transcriptional regulator of viral defense system
MRRPLELLDELVAQGRQEFTFNVAQDALGTSASATANVLRRLGDQGLVDRLTRGHYAIRPLGSLGTAAITEDLPGVVGAAFEGRDHRIAYLSALSELSVLTHPVRAVQVACTEQVRFSAVSRRPLKLVMERAQTIHLEADRVGTSWMSNLERALFESALRVDLVGGSDRLAEALGSGASRADPERIGRLAEAFGLRGQAAERRLASLAATLDLPLRLEPIVSAHRPVIRLDPRDERSEWVDQRFRVSWNVTPDELWAVVGS